MISLSKELIFAEKIESVNGRVTSTSIYDKTKSKSERDKTVEIYNLKQTLSTTLSDTDKIENPYNVISKDKFKEDFKAASLYLLIKQYLIRHLIFHIIIPVLISWKYS